MEGSGIIPTMPVGNGFGGFGGDGIWALLIFAMIFSGGFGFGNRGENLIWNGKEYKKIDVKEN